MTAKDDLEAIAKGFPPHVRAEWERQQRVIRAAAAFVVVRGAWSKDSRDGDGTEDATLAEIKAAVAGLVGRRRR